MYDYYMRIRGYNYNVVITEQTYNDIYDAMHRNTTMDICINIKAPSGIEEVIKLSNIIVIGKHLQEIEEDKNASQT
jgi:hypothetical protein